MMDIIMKIMVEVLSILSIATKEIKGKKLSELITNVVSLLAHPHVERFFKKLAGGSDVEDALKRLDTLTREEARMAIAQILKATYNIDDRVRAVFDGTEYSVSLVLDVFLNIYMDRWQGNKESYRKDGNGRR
jgi:hypothetical protein